ncbi:IS110 family transposase [Aliiglaciecola sp. CAU 1673]|uniref:IS110 family transposase n=1 Tax=Aliiglaciecola sp. CAU 1673 TaxID=3032595 RepID=UPI0023D9A1E5|nr:IS110 family transposase [Aliiglaciecola sp. CAU 1673]MDF2179799.1 IS110 family transposase [Aliiglaciecola sp. CAU 1673]
MSDLTYFYGIDLAKQVFSIHGVDPHGKVIIHSTIKRAKVLSTFANLPAGIVGMEACSAAHYWARELIKLGHDARIMAAKYVAPYCTGAKNDANDARAICEAVSRPHTRFVKIKSPERQAIMMTHRARENWVHERTALINQIRAFLAEFGIVVKQGRHAIQRAIPEILEDADNGLPEIARELVAECYEHLTVLNQRIADLEQCFDILVKASPTAQRLMTISGVGPQTATAILAAIGKGEQFDTGRDFAAWLGLVPRQYSTGGKPKLGRISKKGNKYLRTLLVHGARAVIANLKKKNDKLSQWAQGVLLRRGFKRAIVALAAKHARIIWALLRNDSEFEYEYAA